jgi:hypothetical protein
MKLLVLLLLTLCFAEETIVDPFVGGATIKTTIAQDQGGRQDFAPYLYLGSTDLSGG